jgi:hypothetical protein
LITTLWGKLSIPRFRRRCHQCQNQVQFWGDESLDESGCTPLLLQRTEALALEMSYLSSQKFLEGWGVDISSSQIAELSQRYEDKQQDLCEAKLRELAELPLSKSKIAARVWMIEIDGMFMATRGTTDDLSSGTPYKEVKSVVLYLKNTPSQRYQVSTCKAVSDFEPLVHGLLRFAGVTQNDLLIGLSDAAVWITNLMANLGVKRHILDVYHAATYFQTLLEGLGWDEQAREKERRCLLRGEFDVQKWLNFYITPTTLAVVNANSEAKAALSYLENQSRLLKTDYKRFKAEGFEVIGSGEIEGANKSVLARRLRISGARWGEGGDGKAFARGMGASVRPILEFDSIRLTAFPQAA